jgi:sulfatase maturation enzyme AslB (radical SAM superfamily)
MDIQNLSIVVPAGCPNRCKFCVSRLHEDIEYANRIEKDPAGKHQYRTEYRARLAFARDNGCNTLMYTGDGEPLLNGNFLEWCAQWNRGLEHPFRWAEIQTSGVSLTPEKLEWLKEEIGVSTVSLSLSSVFSDSQNADYNGTPEGLHVAIADLCAAIKAHGFNLRLSLNMTDFYNASSPESVFDRLVGLKADQVTFRILWSAPDPDTDQEREINDWIAKHRADEGIVTGIREYILKHGRKLERLPFGVLRYSVRNISTVLDDDCMSMEAKEAFKYLILRPDCRLYTKWDDPGSLLF